MNLHLNTNITTGYKNNSQKTRVMSEYWIAENIYCLCCGNVHIEKLKNNMPVSDVMCRLCGEIFEIKARKGNFTKKIPDGAYRTMIERITSDTNPSLLLMSYNENYMVFNLTFVPKFFLTPEIIEKRPPLASNARRAGWVSCNILYSAIPSQGKIDIINDGVIEDVKDVVNGYALISGLKTSNIAARGWLFDTLNCVNRIGLREFNLNDIYKFVDELSEKHKDNHNIRAKLRQQLQMLRDKGIIEFLGNGHYRRTI